MDIYERLTTTVGLMPEELKGSALVVLSGQVPDVVNQLGLSGEVRNSVMAELGDILDQVDSSPEGIAQVAEILAAQQEATDG